MYFKLLCSEVSVLPTDIAHLIALFTDYTSEFCQFARSVAETIDPFFRRDAIDMLKYAHYMKVPFFFKPDLARTHLKVAQQIREMFRGIYVLTQESDFKSEVINSRAHGLKDRTQTSKACIFLFLLLSDGQ